MTYHFKAFYGCDIICGGIFCWLKKIHRNFEIYLDSLLIVFNSFEKNLIPVIPHLIYHGVLLVAHLDRPGDWPRGATSQAHIFSYKTPLMGH